MTRELLPGQDEWVWGVDVHARKIAVAFVAPDGHEVRSLIVDQGLLIGSRLLATLWAEVRELAAVWADSYPPLTVWVERPTGGYPNPPLDHAVGVTLAALYAALEHLYLHPVPVNLIPIGVWKKLAVGHGNASKQQTLNWAREHGYQGFDCDEADAFAIATAGSQYATFEAAA